MAYEIPGFSFTLVAGEDLTQYTGVDVEANTGQAVTAGAGTRAIGVVQNKPDDGHSATIVCSGVTKMVVGTGGITAGDDVATDADGKAVTGGTGDLSIGIALKTNAAGTLGTVLLGGNAASVLA